MVAKQVLRAASGWLELGMPEDALEELKGLAREEQGEKRVLELKLAAQMAKEYWREASETARELCAHSVDEPEYFLSAAFCLHENGKTDDARNLLLKGPQVLHEMPVFHYNMACYLWVLGDGERAKAHLDIAIGMDESFLESARDDRDLVGMQL